ncbi:MAG: glycosyltransferase family 39 protein [Deltaproteobacteria bacterium]|nr:glycosyltransferase family 39 protein [Deltaproteobacteria bacterium]
MTSQVSLSPAAKVIGGIAAFWTLAATLLPVVQDEAYYFAWAKYLDLGYFDHPPVVAWIGWPANFAARSFLIARLGTLVTSVLTLCATRRLLRIVGLSAGWAQATGLLLAFGNLMGLAYGFITTPDTALLLAWVLAVSEAALALRGAEWRWLTAGLVTGLGLWSKYMMLLIGPVFLWALVAQLRQQGGTRRGLRGPWPYAGGLVAALVIAPHLYWNAQHDWITIRFQARHGFASEHLGVGAATHLPVPQAAKPGSAEWELGKYWGDLRESEKKIDAAPKPYDDVLKSLNRYVGYYGSQIAAWGGLLGAVYVSMRRRDGDKDAHTGETIYPELKSLMIAATAVPLIVFGLISLGSKVEANWSAMYLLTAAGLLTPHLKYKSKFVYFGLMANLAVILLLLVHALTGLLPVRPDRDRLLAETHGYAALAARLDQLERPVYADSYQITAMANFYGHSRTLKQWPGITRDSEFVRRPEMAGGQDVSLQKAGGFWLVTTDLPRTVTGYVAKEMMQLRDCKDGELQVISSSEPRESADRCARPVHQWYLVRYDVALHRG